MKKKRLLSLVMALAMIFGFAAWVPELNAGSEIKADAYTKHTADEAMSWLDSIVGTPIDYDRQYGAQCVDLILEYYNYLGVSPVGGDASDYTKNDLPAGWHRYSKDQTTPQKGDILVYTGGYQNENGKYLGHVGIYKSDREHYHQNVNGSYVEKITSFAYNGFNFTPYWGVIRPDFKPAWGDMQNLGASFYAKLIISSTNKPLADVDRSLILQENNNNDNQVWYFERQDDGSYTIKNTSSNKYIDVNDYEDADCAIVKTYDYNGSTAQRWRIYGNKNGKYVLNPECSNTRVLDIAGGKNEVGNKAQLYTANETAAQYFTIQKIYNDLGAAFDAKIIIESTRKPLADINRSLVLQEDSSDNNQIWYFERQSDGSYTIKNKASNKYIDVNNYDDYDGAAIKTYDYNGSTAQRWYIYGQSSGQYILAPECSDTRVMDIAGGKNEVGNVAHLYTKNDTVAQLFAIEKVVSVDSKLGNSINIGEDFYAHIKNQSNSLYLTNQSNNVAGEKLNESNNQIWHFIRQSNGSYKIKSFYDDSLIDVSKELDANNQNVHTWGIDRDTTNQQFYIYYAYGAYYFRPGNSNTRVLDMDGTEQHNVTIWTASDDWAPQEFDIIKLCEKSSNTHTYGNWTTNEATCTKDGSKSKSCKICGTVFTQVIPKLGHTWGTPTYKWSDDGKTCTATRICKNDKTHKQTENATITSAVKTPATCTEKGTTAYTASFKNSAFKTQTKDVQDIEAKGHNWSAWKTSSFNIENGTATKKRTCSTCKKTETKTVKNAVTRLSGSGRFATASAISKGAYPSKASTVILANGRKFADALAGATLAKAYDAPILLTEATSLPEETLAEIKRLGATNVIILGGSGSVGTEVKETLMDNGLSIKLVKGKTKFSTAVEIAKATQTKTSKTPTEIFFVSSDKFADALSVSSIAALKKAPIIYLPKSGAIDDVTAEYLKAMKGKIKNAYVIGGSGVISNEVVTAAAKVLGLTVDKTIVRVKGSTKYDTCVAVNTKFASVLTGTAICVATGEDFPDALAGGVFAAIKGAPLFLAAGNLSDTQKSYLKSKNADSIYVLGSSKSVPDTLAQNIAKASVK